ncbi:hypothetical protein QNI19_35525 [Cytophagaceae bacterium DM2B3-1]|uniref:Uncharacterized protein n=1 Tax=Xanthocytophaga flava TaxID=3048013 RepID=A0ABT7CX03_9BACT|nr:hypothetical protein [Xanthocytophaga flavus]MDJ1498300.1 hypothetical protein [Xanthocytophaga flavus]
MRKILCFFALFFYMLWPLRAQQTTDSGGSTLVTDFESGYSFDALHSHSGRGALRVKAGVHSLSNIRLVYKKGASLSIEAFGHFASSFGTLTGKQWADMTIITTGTRLPGTVIAGEVSKVVSSANPVPALVTAAVTAGKYYHNQKVPDAAMQVSYFTNDNKLVHSEYIELTNKARNNWQPLVSRYKPIEDGYAQVSFLNSSPKITYFDDLTATGIDKVERVSFQSNQLVSVKTVMPVKVKNGVNAKETIGVDSSHVISDGAVPNGVPQEPIDGGELPPVVVTPDDGSPGPAVPTTPTNPTIPFPVIPGSGGSDGGGGGSGGGGSTPGTSPNSGLPANPVVNQVYTISKPDGTKVKYQYVCTGASCVWKIVEVSLPQATVIANSNNYNWLPRIPTNGVTILTPAADFAYTYSTATSSWTGLPVPTSENVRDETNNPCVSRIIKQIFASKGNIFSDILNKTFGSTAKADLVIFFDPTMQSPGGTTTFQGNPVDRINISVNPKLIAAGASQEALAATILHELFHAYWDYERLVNKNTTVPATEDAQHDQIADTERTKIQAMLVALFPGMNVDMAEALSWAGLERRPAFSKLTIQKQSNIKLINSQEHAELGFTPQGTKCP